MNLKNRTLSVEIDYYQGIQNIKKNSKSISKHCHDFQNLLYWFLVFLFLYVGLLGFVGVAYQFRQLTTPS